MASVKEVFDQMPQNFNEEAAKGMNAVYQFDITGDGGGKWHAIIEDGSLEVKEGEHDNPNITITMKDSDYLELVEGKLNGQMAFMTGKLKIKGDMGLAMKLNSLFKMGS